MGLPETNPGAQASASVLLTPFDLDQAPTSTRRGFSFGASASAGALTFFVSEGCQSGPGNGELQIRDHETARKWYALRVRGIDPPSPVIVPRSPAQRWGFFFSGTLAWVARFSDKSRLPPRDGPTRLQKPRSRNARASLLGFC